VVFLGNIKNHFLFSNYKGCHRMIKQVVTALAISLLSTVVMAATPAPKFATTFDATKTQCYANFKDVLNQAASQEFGILFMFYNEAGNVGYTIIGKPSTQQVLEIETLVTKVNGNSVITKTCVVHVGQNIPLKFLSGERPAPNQNAAPAPVAPSGPPAQENEAPDTSEKP
jgi:hypothetical protein